MAATIALGRVPVPRPRCRFTNGTGISLKVAPAPPRLQQALGVRKRALGLQRDRLNERGGDTPSRSGSRRAAAGTAFESAGSSRPTRAPCTDCPSAAAPCRVADVVSTRTPCSTSTDARSVSARREVPDVVRPVHRLPEQVVLGRQRDRALRVVAGAAIADRSGTASATDASAGTRSRSPTCDRCCRRRSESARSRRSVRRGTRRRDRCSPPTLSSSLSAHPSIDRLNGTRGVPGRMSSDGAIRRDTSRTTPGRSPAPAHG